MAERSDQVGSPLRSLTIPELKMRRARRKVRASRMRRGGISRPGGRGRMPGFSRKMRRKPTSRRRVSHWKERKSWPMFTKESQQIQDSMAPIGREKPVRSKSEPTIPSKAIRWRAKFDVPKIHPSDGRAQGAVGPRVSVTREMRLSAGRIPLGPIRPGIWKYSERKAKK
jgi:hypothetical protein